MNLQYKYADIKKEVILIYANYKYITESIKRDTNNLTNQNDMDYINLMMGICVNDTYQDWKMDKPEFIGNNEWWNEQTDTNKWFILCIDVTNNNLIGYMYGKKDNNNYLKFKQLESDYYNEATQIEIKNECRRNGYCTKMLDFLFEILIISNEKYMLITSGGGIASFKCYYKYSNLYNLIMKNHLLDDTSKDLLTDDYVSKNEVHMLFNLKK
jgi:hypothetical protein